jgi:hypothetical protein
MWETLARWAGHSQWRHFLIQGIAGIAIFYGAKWLLEPWVPDLIHLLVCQFIGPC